MASQASKLEKAKEIVEVLEARVKTGTAPHRMDGVIEDFFEDKYTTGEKAAILGYVIADSMDALVVANNRDIYRRSPGVKA